MTLSIEDSILRLKAEIIAQDWRLSPKRADQLESAFQCLLDHFTNRKATHAMLVMAANVLGYIKNRGASPPETIDFLKEAMAHIVNIYEDLDDDRPKEDEIFQSLFARFNTLKEKIQQKSPAKAAVPASSHTAQPVTTEQDNEAQENDDLILHQHIEEFKNSLADAGETGRALEHLFELWLDSPKVAAILRGDIDKESEIQQHTPKAAEYDHSCPPTKIRLLTVSGVPLAIQSSVIALIRPMKASAAKTYLQNGTVPLRDFSRFLLKLSSLFNGSLALVPERTLKELDLPLILPQGHELPEIPHGEFSTLLIISNGNWHGALACDEIQKTEHIMHQFIKQQNGDLAGTACLEDGSQLPLLDPLSMLRREGILLMR
ncbi:MAG: hypothetical protein PHI06_04500 [Desulfobulbaceae bacterium]|nr:hypothetical protein [Desulfobulbaceae bacterium]